MNENVRADQAEARCAKAYEEQERLRQLLNQSDRDFAEFRSEHERVKSERDKIQVDLDACRRELGRADERYAHRVSEGTGTMEIAGVEYVVVPRKRWEAIMRESPVRLTPEEEVKRTIDELCRVAKAEHKPVPIPPGVLAEAQERLNLVSAEGLAQAGVISPTQVALVKELQEKSPTDLPAWWAMKELGLYSGSMSPFEALIYVQLLREAFPEESRGDIQARILRHFEGRVNPSLFDRVFDVAESIEKGT